SETGDLLRWQARPVTHTRAAITGSSIRYRPHLTREARRRIPRYQGRYPGASRGTPPAAPARDTATYSPDGAIARAVPRRPDSVRSRAARARSGCKFPGPPRPRVDPAALPRAARTIPLER